MEANQLLAAMQQIIETPGYPYLVSHKEDFYLIDTATLRANFSAGVRYLWVVNKYGTHLTRLGVHPRANSWARATVMSGIQSSDLGAQLYLLNDEGVKLISREQADAEIGRMDYTTVGKVVRRQCGASVATVNIGSYGFDEGGSRFCNLVLHCESPDTLKQADLTALGAIAACEAEEHAQAFFVRVDSILLNGMPIEAYLAS